MPLPSALAALALSASMSAMTDQFAAGSSSVSAAEHLDRPFGSTATGAWHVRHYRVKLRHAEGLGQVGLAHLSPAIDASRQVDTCGDFVLDAVRPRAASRRLVPVLLPTRSEYTFLTPNMSLKRLQAQGVHMGIGRDRQQVAQSDRVEVVLRMCRQGVIVGLQARHARG